MALAEFDSYAPNPTMAAAGLASAQADAMRDAANNSNGAMMGVCWNGVCTAG